VPKIIQFQCECGCKAIRQPSNHWRMVRLNKNGEWTISDWRDEWQDDPNVKYVAGQACAHALLDQFLSAPKEPAN